MLPRKLNCYKKIFRKCYTRLPHVLKIVEKKKCRRVGLYPIHNRKLYYFNDKKIKNV